MVCSPVEVMTDTVWNSPTGSASGTVGSIPHANSSAATTVVAAMMIPRKAAVSA